jgi:hypothetical protein
MSSPAPYRTKRCKQMDEPETLLDFVLYSVHAQWPTETDAQAEEKINEMSNVEFLGELDTAISRWLANKFST